MVFWGWTHRGFVLCHLHTDRWWYTEGGLSHWHWFVVVYWGRVCYLDTDLWWYIEDGLSLLDWLAVVHWVWYVTFTFTGGVITYIEVEALFGRMKISVACPTGKVVISFFLLTVFFNSSIRFWVTVTGFVLRFHNCNISFLLHHQTDWLQCRSMWLACQCS